MDSLIHQNTTAVNIPGPAPCAAVVVFLCAIPLELGIRQGNRPEPPFFHCLFHEQGRILEAALENSAQKDLMFLCLFDQKVDPFFRDFHRLFNQDMLPGTDCRKSRVQMIPGRRCDTDGINFRIR